MKIFFQNQNIISIFRNHRIRSLSCHADTLIKALFVGFGQQRLLHIHSSLLFVFSSSSTSCGNNEAWFSMDYCSLTLCGFPNIYQQLNSCSCFCLEECVEEGWERDVKRVTLVSYLAFTKTAEICLLDTSHPLQI